MFRLIALLTFNLLLGPYWALGILISFIGIQKFHNLIVLGSFGGLLFLLDGLLFGFSARVALYMVSLLILSTGSSNSYFKKKHLSKLLILVLYFSIFFNYTGIWDFIPNVDYLFAANIAHLTRFNFLLGIIASIIIWERFLIDILIMVLGIINKMSFRYGVILGIAFPLAGLLYVFVPLIAETSIQARFRGLLFVSSEWIANFKSLILGKGFVVREDFFWPGDIGLFGSIYEMGLIRVGVLLIFGLLLYKYKRHKMPRFNRFIYGYVLVNYIGKIPVGFIWFL